MKLATFAFLILLAYAHVVGDTEKLLAQPLSLLRDGDHAILGYALFGLQIILALLATAASTRSGRRLEVLVFCLAGLLLVVVAATPSMGPFHDLCSMLLLSLIYFHFAFLLYLSGSGWLFVHLVAPVALLMATRYHSYGLWQKSLILYFVVVINIHYHLLSQFRANSEEDQKTVSFGPHRVKKGRVIYVLGPAKSWRRCPKTGAAPGDPCPVPPSGHHAKLPVIEGVPSRA